MSCTGAQLTSIIETNKPIVEGASHQPNLLESNGMKRQSENDAALTGDNLRMAKTPKPIGLEQSSLPGCADLLEVVLFAPQGANEHDFLLGADVRFGTMTIASDDWTKSVEIGLSRAMLGLDTVGCEIDPSAHRFGDKPPRSVKTHRENTETASTAKQSKGSVSLGISGSSSTGKVAAKGGVGANAGFAKNKNFSSTAKQVVEALEDPVVALSRNRWRFSSVGEDFLQSRYAGGEPLCKIKITSASVKIEGKLSFYPKDLTIIDTECTSTSLLDSWRKSPTKAAIAKVLVAKHLKGLNPDDNLGRPIAGGVSVLKGDF
jgi:hypothetical protein